MAWDWAAIGAVVGGVSTAVVALLTWVLIQENRLIRKAGNSPRIVASFEPHPEGNGALKLALSNVGTGPALDVSYSFEYEDGDFENYDLLLKYAVSRPAITMIAQGEKFSFIFAIGYKLFKPKDPRVSTQLRPFFVSVTWRSLDSQMVLSEKYRLDIDAYRGLPGLIEKPPLVRMADSLEAIRMLVAKFATNSGDSPRCVDLTSLEQSVRTKTPLSSPD